MAPLVVKSQVSRTTQPLLSVILKVIVSLGNPVTMRPVAIGS